MRAKIYIPGHLRGMKKRRNKPKRNPLRSRPKPTKSAIEALAAAGQSEDAIALRYQMRKNVLRARFADALDSGRELERVAAGEVQAEAAAQTKTDEILLDGIKSSFDSPWFDPEYGNLLFSGARTVEEAIEHCKQYGHFRVHKRDPK